MAVFHAGFFDIETVVRRSVGSVLVVAVATAAAVAVLALLGLFDDVGVAAVATVAGVTLLALAIRNRAQRIVDRRLFGLGTDASAVMEHVGARLDGAAAHSDALKRFVDALADALRLPYVAVVPTDSATPDAAHGEPSLNPEEFPIVADGRNIATLKIGRRAQRDRFTMVERTALVDASRRAGALLQAVTLSEDLRRSHERLVMATEEERRRLSRELHDGLGPALAGMALQLDGMTARFAGDPELLHRADRLRNQLREAVREVRRIVTGLRPSALEQSDLATAVKGLVALDQDRVEVAVSGDPANLPAAVEGAAFRIAAEATTNALRHGRPNHCVVRLCADTASITVEVCDDGLGFGSGPVAGVGLSSMHERAAEVGGELTVESVAGAGTTVRARLPRATR